MENYNLTLHASWEEVKEKIKERNISLTDEDLAYEPGQEEALIQRLAKKLDKSEDDVKGYIESISFNKNIAS